MNITKRELARWMQAFSEDKRIPKDVRVICADMYLRANPHSSAGYTRGCRCEICRKARNEQIKKWRKKK